MSYKNDICEQASKIISGERQGQYGAPEDSFAVIAKFWNVYLDARDVRDSEGHRINAPILANDVANMMALMKIARISNGVFKEDSYVDAIGYLAIGAELNKKEDVYLVNDPEKIILVKDGGTIDIRNIVFNQKPNDEEKCSDSCGIDIPGGDPDSTDEGEEEENKIEDCYHCFYFNRKYVGCLRGNHAIKEIGCNGFKDRTSCLTCAHNDYSVIHDDGEELRVLCKLDDEYHSNTRACDNWEEGEV